MAIEKSCLIPSIIAGVCGALFIGALIAVIFLAVNPGSSSVPLESSSSEVPVTFNEYTALIWPIIQRQQHTVYQNTQIMSVFATGEFSIGSYDEKGNLVSRSFSTEYGTLTTCVAVGTHGNCYKTTSGVDVSFSLAGKRLVEYELPCDALVDMFLPLGSLLFIDRNLSFCDLYETSSFNELAHYIVESGTKYPVMEISKVFDDQQTTISAYLTFIPGKPSDESGLQPFPGVTVYDFRDHEGDCGDSTFTRRTDGAYDSYMETIRRGKRIRDLLHLPSIPPVSINPFRIRRNVHRDSICIPTEFDARTQWPSCASVIGTITNQDPCGSCWAMSSSGVLADRMCISWGVKKQLSPQYMVYCGEHTMGCGGAADSTSPWVQLMEEGTVPEECVPFAGTDGKCPDQCWDGTLITDNMLVRADGIAFPWGRTAVSRVREIQTEILLNGPVQASFLTFSDFDEYDGGVYHRSKEAVRDGAHAIRIIGWGTTDDGEDYWLVANSWGPDWGENGLFRIRRGTNECNIEEQVVAGIV